MKPFPLKPPQDGAEWIGCQRPGCAFKVSFAGVVAREWQIEEAVRRAVRRGLSAEADLFSGRHPLSGHMRDCVAAALLWEAERAGSWTAIAVKCAALRAVRGEFQALIIERAT